MEDLADVSDWHLLGSSLGLETSQLNEIERDIPAVVGANRQRKNQVLYMWIKGKPDLSWKDIVSALMKMGEHNIADDMNKKYSGSVAVSSTQRENEDALVIARENEHKLRGMFAKLEQLVSTKLQAMSIDMEKFSSLVRYLFLPADCIPTTGNIDETFFSIGRNELWDFMNYSPLQVIADTFGGDDPDLQQAFQKYREALAGYRVSTKVIHYFATWSHFSEDAYYSSAEQTVARRDERYFVKLSMKLKAKATEKSIQYLTELWERVSEYLLLPTLPYILDEIISGSIWVIWLIPPSIVPTLIIKCIQPSVVKFLSAHGVCSLSTGSIILYEEQSFSIADLQQSYEVVGEGRSEQQLELFQKISRLEKENLKLKEQLTSVECELSQAREKIQQLREQLQQTTDELERRMSLVVKDPLPSEKEVQSPLSQYLQHVIEEKGDKLGLRSSLMGQPVKVIRGLKKPWKATFSSSGQLIVNENKWISIFDVEGKLECTIVPELWHSKVTLNPTGVANDDSGIMYMCDCDMHKLLKVSSNGKVLKSVGGLSNGHEQFNYPDGIALRDNKLYICDSGFKYSAVT